MNNKKNLSVGGPTAVINSSLYGVVKESLAHPDRIEHVYGMVNGIEGFLKDMILDFSEVLSEEELEYLKNTPGAYLGSCRCKLPEDLSDPVYPKLFCKFENLNIGYILYIGGNDSMDTVPLRGNVGQRYSNSWRTKDHRQRSDSHRSHPRFRKCCPLRGNHRPRNRDGRQCL